MEGAIAVYRQPGDSGRRQVCAAVSLAELLTRHGRGDEAITVMRSLADSHGADDWIADMLCNYFVDQGRPEDGLAWLDDLKVRCGEEEWTFFRMRLPLMAACERHDEALERARAHPEAETWYAALAIAALQVDAGHIEAALATLRQQSGTGIVRAALAGYLVDFGRVEEAVTLRQC